jgi:hypothetical protein
MINPPGLWPKRVENSDDPIVDNNYIPMQGCTGKIAGTARVLIGIEI